MLFSNWFEKSWMFIELAFQLLLLKWTNERTCSGSISVSTLVILSCKRCYFIRLGCKFLLSSLVPHFFCHQNVLPVISVHVIVCGVFIETDVSSFQLLRRVHLYVGEPNFYCWFVCFAPRRYRFVFLGVTLVDGEALGLKEVHHLFSGVQVRLNEPGGSVITTWAC